MQALKTRRSGQPHPFVTGPASEARYLTVAAECANARAAALTQPLVRDPDDRAGAHTWRLGQHPFHLGGVHVGAAPDDDLALAAHHPQVAARLDFSQIAA